MRGCVYLIGANSSRRSSFSEVTGSENSRSRETTNPGRATWQELQQVADAIEGSEKIRQQAWEELELVLDRRERVRDTMRTSLNTTPLVIKSSISQPLVATDEPVGTAGIGLPEDKKNHDQYREEGSENKLSKGLEDETINDSKEPPQSPPSGLKRWLKGLFAPDPVAPPPVTLPEPLSDPQTRPVSEASVHVADESNEDMKAESEESKINNNSESFTDIS